MNEEPPQLPSIDEQYLECLGALHLLGDDIKELFRRHRHKLPGTQRMIGRIESGLEDLRSEIDELTMRIQQEEEKQ